MILNPAYFAQHLEIVFNTIFRANVTQMVKIVQLFQPKSVKTMMFPWQ